ncbi:MAG: TonB-dependent receptor [Sandaracinaceae bacterium]|nr:TonB-dependent receptor [Sandaracinaceae bacterium]
MTLRIAALVLLVSASAASRSARADDEASDGAALPSASEEAPQTAETPSSDGPDADEVSGEELADEGAPADLEAEEEDDDFDVSSSAEDLPSFGSSAVLRASSPRASTTVTRDEMRERLARSAPDALRYVPGVSVQQTTHGQASPYVRGVTGQQVLLAFDGIRLNNGVYRQGPNQYFFTVDAATLDRIEVERGSASTRWGSDALGGAILAMAAEPTLDPSRDGLNVHARALGRFGSQDLDAGGRLELDAQLGRDVAILVGGGYRAAQPLQGSGVLTNPSDGRPTLVPLIGDDGRTQLGTGYRYATFDGRLVWRVAPELRLVAAVYGFRQYDTPRADQCPPPSANERDCMVYVEQFRTLAYVSLRGRAGPELREVELTASYQRQHELREQRQPSIYALHDFRDDLDTIGLTARLGSRRFVITPDVGAVVRGGGDAYVDMLSSAGFFHDLLTGAVRQRSRGLYSDDARYYTGGLFVELDADLFHTLRIRGGLRAGFAGARAPGDPVSGTQPVHLDFAAPVGRVGAELTVTHELSLLANVDQGFRAPNLDDLTSRQIVGPGYQLENPELRPERSMTYELGARVRTAYVSADVWAYAMELSDGMYRRPRTLDECPNEAPECRAAFSRFQLINLPESGWLLGAEASIRVVTPFGLGATATVAYAWGEGPSPARIPDPDELRVPLSRVPPLNGTVELRYAHDETHLVVGVAMRWAAAQDRLALSDRRDPRIPIGGTPAYAVFDLRAGWRFEHYLQLTAVFENVFDQVYRVHGSGVNGPGRGVVVQLEGSY